MFRVIMPVYNSAKYLEKAVDSIINQTLNFEDNIVIHLLDDDSKDDSLNICNKYKEKYPNNIIVTHFNENIGVSKSRNFGIKCALKNPDDITVFVDSDDMLEPKVMEIAGGFFDANPDINIAASEIYFFGAREGSHKSNWRFEEKEIVNIYEDFNFPQFYIGGVFFKYDALKRMKFDSKMEFWEDAFAINKVILKEEKYGLLRGAIYYYRQVEDGGSLVGKAWRNKNRYDKFLKQGYQRLMNYCLFRKGKVIPYIQFVVAYHLRLFFLEGNRDVVMEMIKEDEMEAFKKRLRKVLKRIDDDVIASLNTAIPVIEEELSIKYGRKERLKNRVENDDIIFYYGNIEKGKMSERAVKIIGISDKEEFKGMIRGRFSSPYYEMKDEDYIFAVCDGEKIKSERHKCKKKIYILDDLVKNYKNAGFVVDIPDSCRSARFGIHALGNDVLMNEVNIEEIRNECEMNVEKEAE